MKTKLLLANRALIILFAISSGIFKVLQGGPDLEVFSHLGMNAAAVAAFGAVQALGGLGLIFAASRKPAAIVVIASNVLATVGLFAAGVQPFGAISIAFVVMAALTLSGPTAAPSLRPAQRGV